MFKNDEFAKRLMYSNIKPSRFLNRINPIPTGGVGVPFWAPTT